MNVFFIDGEWIDPSRTSYILYSWFVYFCEFGQRKIFNDLALFTPTSRREVLKYFRKLFQE